MSLVKGVIEQTTNPTVNDDITKGYYIGFRWINTITSTIFTIINNTEGNAVWIFSSGLFSQIEDSATISGTTVETSIIGVGIGSLTIPMNNFIQGNSYTLKMGGIISCGNNETIQFRIKSGSAVLGDTGLVVLPTITSRFWELELDFTIRNIGEPTEASIVMNGQLVYIRNEGTQYEGQGFDLINNTTFDTTISNTLEITVEWGSNSGENSIYSTSLVLFKIF